MLPLTVKLSTYTFVSKHMIDVYKGIAECDVNHIPIQYSAIFTGQSSVTSGNTAQGMVRAGCWEESAHRKKSG